MLQMFEAKWTTMEDRMADIFQTGYGQLWLPPPARADQGGLSVGYDVFDRFDLGKPRNETLYGTETSLRANITAAHNANMKVYTDFIPNHNGFSNSNTPGFAAAGGYPGFVLSTPTDQFGDFHDPSISYQTNGSTGSLFGLIDIAQEKNHSMIRHPTVAGPNTIPAGTVRNIPDPNNARFYVDTALPGVSLTDPALGGTSFTRRQFNLANPLAGDPSPENATGLLMRNMQWMIQVMGVDGFRIDAARHLMYDESGDPWPMKFLENAVYRTSLQTNFDGTIKPIYMFSEVADGDRDFVQRFFKRELPNKYGIDPNDPAMSSVKANRDVMDFPLFYALRSNLSGNGTANNWHNVINAPMDKKDDGLMNGSEGVMFVDSHDEQSGIFPYLMKVAHAYTLMLPGNTMVYMNAKQFGDNRDFPHDIAGGTSNDALGGFYGDSVAKLVEIRNTHGRGNFKERWIDPTFSNIYVYERENSAVVGLNSRIDSGFDERTVNTGFDAGTVLVELTGNATSMTVDPTDQIRDTVRVNASKQITIRIPRNKTGTTEHGLGYVVYGVAPPQGTLSLTNVASVLEGATPTQATNGTARLADIDVITANTFKVRLNTTPVTLAAPVGESTPVRDLDADGDQAVLRIDGGMNLNNVAGIDRPNPADVSYAFEDFTDVRTPGYGRPDGMGTYEQTIDTTQLSEGRHYITVRAYRHRAVAGTPVFTDFKKTIYVDRLKPEAALVSFDPYASDPNNPNNRDLIVRSTDQTANSMHFFLDLGPAKTDAEIIAMAQAQQNNGQAGTYDRDSFISGFPNVITGNHAATVVTFEPTGNVNVQRFNGMFTDTNLGLGFGDLSGDGAIQPQDVSVLFRDVLYSRGASFNAAADIDGDGEVTNLDLFDLGDFLTPGVASDLVRQRYDELLVKRADVNNDGLTNAGDVASLYSAMSGPALGEEAMWYHDLDVDGDLDTSDVETLITQLVRTSHADFNLDRRVDGRDFLIWQMGLGTNPGRFDLGDATLGGGVTDADLAIWTADYGKVGPIITASAASAGVPEPGAAALALAAAATWSCRGRRRPSAENLI